jgi:hypothetical protein
MWGNFKFEGVLFRRDSSKNDRVNSIWECATKQAAMTLGGLWLLTKNMFKMDSCLRGAIFHLTEIRSIWTLIEECSNIDTGAVKNNTAAYNSY